MGLGACAELGLWVGAGPPWCMRGTRVKGRGWAALVCAKLLAASDQSQRSRLVLLCVKGRNAVDSIIAEGEEDDGSDHDEDDDEDDNSNPLTEMERNAAALERFK
jgi:hypothetical protein